MTTDSSTLSAPEMSAETGYDLVDDHAPLRISGIISLILGLLSVLSVVAVPLLAIPITAMAFGFFALRKYDGRTPAGVNAAKVGLVLAAGFGACGFFLPWMKTMTLGRQAEYFARQYLSVVAQGELELALELKKHHVNRYLDSMSLKQHYVVDPQAAEALKRFGEDGVNSRLRKLGPDAEFELERATRVFHSYGDDRAEMILVNKDGQSPFKIYMMLIYQPHKETGVGHWRVHECTIYHDPIVAESIL